MANVQQPSTDLGRVQPQLTTTGWEGAPSSTTSMPRGAIILDGSHGAIALARVLARQKLDVWFLSEDITMLRFSRAVRHWRRWPGAENPHALDALEQVVREEGLEGYILIPAADAEVKFVSQAHERLSRHLNVLLTDWSKLQWAANKAQAYRRAAQLGLAVPLIHPVRTTADAAEMPMQFPVVLKPAMRITTDRFSRDKVWRADDRQSFMRLYAEAARLVGPEMVVVQELIPGDGESQLSYAGLWWQGRPITSFVARRSRQYPIDFSYTSTFVETTDPQDVREVAETFLLSIGHHGLCEMEFKRDPRSGLLKLLDINPRPWSWFGLAAAAGIDFGAAIVALASGRMPPPMQARMGIGWMFAQRDPIAALQFALAGRLGVRAWLGSLARTRTFATFSLGDPVPGLMEVPLTFWRILARTLAGLRLSRHDTLQVRHAPRNDHHP